MALFNLTTYLHGHCLYDDDGGVAINRKLRDWVHTNVGPQTEGVFNIWYLNGSGKGWRVFEFHSIEKRHNIHSVFIEIEDERDAVLFALEWANVFPGTHENPWPHRK